MSTDTMPGRTSVDAPVETWNTVATDAVAPQPHPLVAQDLVAEQPAPAESAPRHPAPREPYAAAAAVAPSTLTAHAIDRADARLERLCDELELLRATAAPSDDIDVAENDLIFAIAEAERTRRSLDA